MKVYLYPTPLHYRQIPELIDKAGATVLFGTDTFLAGYARNADAYGFRTLRYVISGAEPLKAETRRIYMEKFGLRLLEGYGVTEASPVLAVNTPAFNKIGTVGKLLPFVEPRLEPVPGIDEGGRLIVRGPNVMIGYYRADNPGRARAAGRRLARHRRHRGDRRGRLRRRSRAAPSASSRSPANSSRSAPLEDLVSGLWPDDLVAAVAAPDPKRGERVILATTHAGRDQGRGPDLDEDQGRLRHHGPRLGRRARRDPAARLGEDRLYGARAGPAGAGGVTARDEAISGRESNDSKGMRRHFRARLARQSNRTSGDAAAKATPFSSVNRAIPMDCAAISNPRTSGRQPTSGARRRTSAPIPGADRGIPRSCDTISGLRAVALGPTAAGRTDFGREA